jgi:hypothetical protein
MAAEKDDIECAISYRRSSVPWSTLQQLLQFQNWLRVIDYRFAVEMMRVCGPEVQKL